MVSSYKGADPLAMPALPLPQGLLPPKARLLLGDGSWREVPSESVAAGDVLTVLPGDRVPVDGVRAKPAYPPACLPACQPACLPACLCELTVSCARDCAADLGPVHWL